MRPHPPHRSRRPRRAPRSIAPAAASAASPIKVSEKEFSISGVPKTLKHGVKYTITLANKGKYPHDLLFDGKKVDDVGVHNKNAVASGKSASLHGHVPRRPGRTSSTARSRATPRRA